MFCPQCRVEYREGFSRCSDCQVDLVEVLPLAEQPEPLEFVEILATYNPADIAIIKSLLDGEQITYHFVGEHLTLRPIGDAARLMVRRQEAEDARQLLQDLELSYLETSFSGSHEVDESEESEEPDDSGVHDDTDDPDEKDARDHDDRS